MSLLHQPAADTRYRGHTFPLRPQVFYWIFRLFASSDALLTPDSGAKARNKLAVLGCTSLRHLKADRTVSCVEGYSNDHNLFHSETFDDFVMAPVSKNAGKRYIVKEARNFAFVLISKPVDSNTRFFFTS